MFTVLICDKHVEEDCHGKFYMYLKPFLKNEDFAFCTWDATGETVDEALPELKNIIRSKSEWRAVIVNDSSTWSYDAVNKRNPFDYVSEFTKKADFSTFKGIESFRENEENKLSLALSNPLTKLGMWLLGSPYQVSPKVCFEEDDLFAENMADEKKYFSMLKKMSLSAEDVETDMVKLKRYRKINSLFNLKGEVFNKPQQVMVIAERSKDVSREEAETAWREHTEFDYSRFYISNLYPEKFRYLIYDIPYIRGIRNENRYFDFLNMLLLMCTKEYPGDTFRANRVYKAEVSVDTENIKALCRAYNAKLKATLLKIRDITARLKEKEQESIDDKTAEECFESKVTVPVKVDSAYDTTELYASHNGIGLSKDCPEDEYQYWDGQYHDINKTFMRYLREPRRAVKTAATGSFRRLNKNHDERALQLDEFQKEDVLLHIQSEEAEMISTVTTHLYDTEKYKEKLAESDKELKKTIGQRMTRKKTFIVGLIAALAYMLGFIPLLWSNVNNLKSVGYSAAVAGVAIGAFLVCGFIYLIFLRGKLVKKFKEFNEVMASIIEEIEGSLSMFSKYLSHACNVMRGFSVLNYTEDSYEKRYGILNLHESIIFEKIKEINELFAAYLENEDFSNLSETEPYDYDFMSLKEYSYELPYTSVGKNIEFLQDGNIVSVPVDYLKSVSITREELYD